ncbi:MAG: transposase [Rhodospirillales bacterium]|nr:transposase [Rhodospirillales bacterium]
MCATHDMIGRFAADCVVWRWVGAAALALTIGLATGSPLRAHEGHGHENAMSAIPSSVAPRAEASSENFELVAVAAERRLIVYLDRYIGNDPVVGGAVELIDGDVTTPTQEVAEGVYSIPEWTRPSGRYDLVFSISAGGLSDLLVTTLVIPPPVDAGAAQARIWIEIAVFAVGFLALWLIYVARRGKVDRLLLSGARFSETTLVLSASRAANLETVETLRIGPPLVFDHLWRETECAAVIDELAAPRRFEFPVERAVFATVLHRLFDPGADRSCEKWLESYRIEDGKDLELRHFRDAMAWLGEEIPDQEGRTLAPRTNKDLVEEELFARRRDPSGDLDLVFFNAPSLVFPGNGDGDGKDNGKNGAGDRATNSGDRPSLHQMVVGVVLDGKGRPICSETWPGAAMTAESLPPVIERLRSRFSINRVCVVADAKMVSDETVAALEKRGIEYIVGMRDRADEKFDEIVFADDRPMIPIKISLIQGGVSEIRVKEVTLRPRERKGRRKGHRYVACFSPEQARQDAAGRAAVVETLKDTFRLEDRSLAENPAYRRYLIGGANGALRIDDARITEEAKYDGFYVLETNSKLPFHEVALRYRQIGRVEDVFKSAKIVLESQPVYYSNDAAIRGHLFCSFLAMVVRKEMEDRLAVAGQRLDWRDVVRDLDRIVETEIVGEGKRFILRNQAPGSSEIVCEAAGVTLPPLFRRQGSMLTVQALPAAAGNGESGLTQLPAMAAALVDAGRTQVAQLAESTGNSLHAWAQRFRADASVDVDAKAPVGGDPASKG